MSNAAWKEMLEEFRALGGTAENLCLRQGKFGRGLFAEDPAKPILLRVPENLLFPIEEVVLENGALRAGPPSQAGSREKSWLERYQNDFSWGGGGRADIERLLEMFQALPDSLRQLLEKYFALGAWFQDFSAELVRERFLRSRVIEYRKRTVVMPIVELVNHGHLGGFDDSDGVSIKGQFGDEILVNYGGHDALGLLQGWGFASDELMAIGVPATVKAKFGDLVISREIDKGDFIEVKAMGRIKLPRLTVDEGRPTLSFVTLGMKRTPRVPRSLFYSLFRDAGLPDAEETFDMIHHQNRMQFLMLIEALEGLQQPIVRTLRDMARFQLQAMSHCFGTRDL